MRNRPVSNGQVWKHKSVRALMRSAHCGDPVAIIHAKTREIVATAKSIGWSGPPFDPLQLASILGIRSRQSSNLFTAEAQLTPMEGNQLLLEFNPERSPGRRNYSISHELVHTLFDDCFEMVHQRRMNRSVFDPEFELERLCQIGAAEFLMPLEEFTDDVQRFGFSLRSVVPLSARYGASREAAARRMLALAQCRAALVFFSHRCKQVEIRDGNGTPKMRALYTIPANNFPVYIPEHKSVPDDSCIYRAISTDKVVEGIEEWDLANFGRWHVEAMALPGNDEKDDNSPSIVALLREAF